MLLGGEVGIESYPRDGSDMRPEVAYQLRHVFHEFLLSPA